MWRRISAAPNFVPVLTPGSLDRCDEPTDWLRQEIAHAIREGKNIVPVMVGNFSFPPKLPDDIANLPRHQGVAYSHQYFDAMMQTIMEGLVLEERAPERCPPLSPASPSPTRPAERAAPLHWSYDLMGGAGVGLVGGLVNIALLATNSSIDALAVGSTTSSRLVGATQRPLDAIRGLFRRSILRALGERAAGTASNTTRRR
jgi:hypothetical protein